MHLVKGIVISLLRILTIHALDVISEEENLPGDRTNDHIQHHPKDAERRFLEDLDDNDWHVSHLKDLEFDFKNDCKDDTFENRVNKYRKTLKEDGSLIEYVSADALPVSDADLVKNRCVAANTTSDDNAKPKNKEVTQPTHSKSLVFNDKPVTKEVNSATTAEFKMKAKEKNDTKPNARRASEYQFSSDEYYDEVDDFDNNLCPDFVEVIHLEIDTLRNYDVECESLVEWRSLE